MANQEHLTLLKSCLEQRNLARWNENRPNEVDLRGVDLKGMNLSKANLKGADLSGADLLGVDLSEANLSEAILSNTQMIGARLDRADLRQANLSNAYLAGAKLNEANLREAILSNAHLPGAQLKSTTLDNANLSDAQLSGANLSGAHLRGANVTRTDFRGATLRETDLSETNLKEADLRGTFGLSSAIVPEGSMPPKGVNWGVWFLVAILVIAGFGSTFRGQTPLLWQLSVILDLIGGAILLVVGLILKMRPEGKQTPWYKEWRIDVGIFLLLLGLCYLYVFDGGDIAPGFFGAVIRFAIYGVFAVLLLIFMGLSFTFVPRRY